MKKKCLNCLCLNEVNEKVCRYCRTPFSRGKLGESSSKDFTPPTITERERSKTIIVSRQISNIFEDRFSNLEIEDVDLEDNEEQIEKENKFIGIKSLIERHLEKQSSTLPYKYKKFEIDNFDIAELDIEEKEIEEIKIDSIKIENKESLQELQDLANAFGIVDEEKVKKEEIDNSEKDFSTTEVIRSSDIDISEKSDEQPSNIMKDVIDSIESFEKETQKLSGDNLNEMLSVDDQEKSPVKNNETQLFNLSDLDSPEEEVEKNTSDNNFFNLDKPSKESEKDPKTEEQVEKNASENNFFDLDKPSKESEENLEGEPKIEEKVQEKKQRPEKSNKEDVKTNNVVGFDFSSLEKPNKKETIENKPAKINVAKETNVAPKDITIKTSAIEGPPEPLFDTQARGSTNFKALECYKKAKVLRKKGQLEFALKELTQSLRLDYEFDQAHILLSKVYLEINNQ